MHIFISILIQAFMWMMLNFIASTSVCLCFSTQVDVCAGLRISLRHEYDFPPLPTSRQTAGYKKPTFQTV